MTKAIVIHPRGFSTYANNSSIKPLHFSDGDPEINLLYSQLLREPRCIKDWDYVASVMRVTSRLIGDDFNKWLDLQRDNLYLHSQAIGFINDTIRYIEGGPRTVTNINWIELLEERPEPLPRKLVSPTINPLNKVVEGLNYLNLWFKREGGLSDLVVTLFAMYGIANPSSLRLDGTKPISNKNPYLLQLKKILG